MVPYPPMAGGFRQQAGRFINRPDLSVFLSTASLQHQFLDFADGFRGVQSFRTGARAIHDRMATIEFEGIFQIIQTCTGVFIAAIDDPAIGLQQNRRA